MQIIQEPTGATVQLELISVVEMDQAKEFLANYDVSYIFYRLVQVDKWSRKSARKVLQQYKNFLFLQKKYGLQHRIIPSLEIDAVWHAHILHTKDYAEFCQEFFGRFLHHVPQKPGVEESAVKINADFKLTQELYKNEFGDYIYRVKKRPLFGW